MDYEVSCENKNEALTLPVDAKLLAQLARAEYFNQLRVVCEEIGLVVTGDKDKFVFDVLSALVVGTEPPKKEDIAKDKEDDFTVTSTKILKSWRPPKAGSSTVIRLVKNKTLGGENDSAQSDP